MATDFWENGIGVTQYDLHENRYVLSHFIAGSAAG